MPGRPTVDRDARRPRSRRTPARTVVTGAERVVAARLVAELAGAEGADRVEGVAGVPARRGWLRGAGTLVHLAPDRDPAAPRPARARQLQRTAAVLEEARAAGVRRVVLVTSTDVHRAEPGQVPLPEDAAVAAPADDSLVGSWVETERLADHARRTGLDVVVLRPAALVGVEDDQQGAPLRSLTAARLLAVRGVEPLWQLCHVDDLVAALVLAAGGAVTGACAVAAEGWLAQAEVERLTGRRRLELPAAVAVSTAERLHRLGVSAGSPSELDLLLAPVVVTPARLPAAGWSPRWTAREALLDAVRDLPPPTGDRTAAYAAGTAGATAALLGTAALVRARRRRRR